MKVEWWTLRFCRYATSVTVQSWVELAILGWCCMLSCATGCSTSWHHRRYRHFPRRAPSNLWTCRGPYCSGGDRWQKLAQAGKEASTSGACTTLQPSGQTGEAGWQTVQLKGLEPLHTCRLETHCSCFSSVSTVYTFYTRGQLWCLSVCLQAGQLNGSRNIFCGLVTLWKAWEELTRFWRRSWMSSSNKEESRLDCNTTLETLIYILFVNYTNKFIFFFICVRFFVYIFVSIRIYR